MKCIAESKNEFKGEVTTLFSLFGAPKNMFDMKPNAYHYMHQIEQISVIVSSTLAQIKVHGRVHENKR